MRDAQRCTWPGDDPLSIAYHDHEWGVPLHDDQRLFEFLVLDGFQAGLSWLTILRKREHFRRAFHRFEASAIAAYTDADVRRLMQDAGIVRNRQKILATIDNARAFRELQADQGSFDRYIWQFVRGGPIQNRWTADAQVPAVSAESQAMSRDLKARGFRFVGPTICYAFMQAAGLVNDHLCGCFRHAEVAAMATDPTGR
ncbi:MAG: DNA-3-methyladenine glycosylase I [Desulfosarcinaceae bacterium]|nr:DNA-3-methyladenine glycosylase I [Desulfosarcinaceae bacterium]